MRNLLPWAVMLAFIPLSAGVYGAVQTKAPAKKPAASKTAAKKTSAKKTTAKAGPSSTKAKSTVAVKKRRGAVRQPAVTWRNRQSVPSQERYREIQSALAAKGYLAQESATGEWNQASVDALKRFQAEQSLNPTGKLNSLSLIALGLGPKYEAKATVPPPAPVPATQN